VCWNLLGHDGMLSAAADHGAVIRLEGKHVHLCFVKVRARVAAAAAAIVAAVMRQRVVLVVGLCFLYWLAKERVRAESHRIP
jgi:hypothetical protein